MKTEKKRPVRTNILTGFVALLPIALLLVVLIWFYNIVQRLTAPLANYFGASGAGATFIAIVGLFVALFFIGVVVRTKLGFWLMTTVEKYVFMNIPGYKMVKTIIEPFAGSHKNAFKGSVLVDVFDNGTYMTGFITDDKDEKFTTVFIPTAPNPTNGLIYHVPKKRVVRANVNVDKVLTSVIACGNGSEQIIKKSDLTKKREKK